MALSVCYRNVRCMEVQQPSDSLVVLSVLAQRLLDNTSYEAANNVCYLIGKPL